MAIDVRLLVSILKIIEDLVRVGRYGKDIAAMVEELSQKPHVKKIIHIPQMERAVAGMVRDSLEAFQSGVLDKINDIAERDNEVDEIQREIFRECITYMLEDPTTITRPLIKPPDGTLASRRRLFPRLCATPTRLARG